jgi:type I restriction enzyme S subunit
MTVVSKASAYPKSVQSGLPRLGACPPGWTRGPLSAHLIEELRPLNMADDEAYDLVTVKRSRGGVVLRERLTGSQIAVKSQFRLKAGDFLISKRQIVHGACGIVPPELDGSIVSNEYSVLRARPTLDLEFLNCLANSIHFQQTCFHSSIGVHVEKMIFKLDEWLKWEFNLPSVSEQRRIAKVLSTWDLAIQTVQKLIDNAHVQKQALMQKSLAEKRWPKLTLGQVTKIKSGGTPSKEIGAYWGGTFPWISAKDLKTHNVEGAELNLTDAGVAHANIAPAQSVLILVRGMTLLKNVPIGYLKRPAAFNQDIKALIAEPDLDPLFLSYYLVHSKPTLLSLVTTANHGTGRLDTGLLQSLQIPIPTLPEQKRITKAFINTDDSIQNLGIQISMLRQERAALLQQMLTGRRRLQVKYDEIEQCRL